MSAGAAITVLARTAVVIARSAASIAGAALNRPTRALLVAAFVALTTCAVSAIPTSAGPSDQWYEWNIETNAASTTTAGAPLTSEPIAPCRRIESKFCRLVRAAEDADPGIDPTLIAAIGIHESGFSGPFGFGILGRSGYRSANSPVSAVGEFLSLVQGDRYRSAWEQRDDNVAFLNAIVDAGYAGREGRGWPPKILWLRGWMIEHPTWGTD